MDWFDVILKILGWVGGPVVIIGSIAFAMKRVRAVKAATLPLDQLRWTYILKNDPQIKNFQNEIPLPVLDCYRSESLFKKGYNIHYFLIRHEKQGYAQRFLNEHRIEGYTSNVFPYVLLRFVNDIFSKKTPCDENDSKGQQEVEILYDVVSQKVFKP